MPTIKKTPTTARKTVRKASTRSTRTSRTSMPLEDATQTSTQSAMMSGNLQRNLRIALVLAIILGLLYYFRGLFIVAMVNGKPVTRYEVIRDLEKQAGKGATDAIVSKKLVAMKAAEKGITIPQKDIDARIADIEKDLKASGQTLDEVLKSQGITRAEVEEQTRLQLMLKALLKDKIKVTDTEVDEAMEQQIESKPEGMSDAEFKKQVRSSLEEQQFSFEAQSYIQELQNSAKVTYWHNY